MESKLNNLDAGNVANSQTATGEESATFLPTPNSQQLQGIRHMASLAMRPEAIAQSLKVPVDHLLKTCGPEIAAASLASHKAVLESLHAMATSEDCAAATIFWVKNMCADLLRTPETKETGQRSPKRNEPVTPENVKPIEFDVYCNDGEPNFDY